MAAKGSRTPWADGTYRCKSLPTMLLVVQGEKGTLQGFGIKEDDENAKGTWKYGVTGEANEAVVEVTGKKFNDVHIVLYKGMMDQKGVLSEDGKKVTFWSGITNQLDAYEWMTEEEIEEFNNYGDPADAPTNHYKIQPEYQGKFLFITGAPGLGKSTTGLLLSKIAGYVYYEADCFMNGANPYLPPDSKEPTIDAMKQKPLKGISKKREETIADGLVDLLAWLEGGQHDMRKIEEFYKEMCEDLVRERMRMGGDWVVAQAVPTRRIRDMMKKLLGPDVIFVVLRMSSEDQKERVKQRHGDGEEAQGALEMLTKANKVFEPATEDEEKAVDVLITTEMTREDVVNKILRMVQ